MTLDTRIDDFDVGQVAIRSARDEDCSAIRSLFEESMIEGQVRLDDNGDDLDNLRDTYLCDGAAFWVADYLARVIGMIGVRCTSANVAEVCRLRVSKAFRRRGVGSLLMEKAVSFCHHNGYLKVVLDVRVERGPAIALFEKFGFVLSRQRDQSGMSLLDFYMDIYRDPRG